MVGVYWGYYGSWDKFYSFYEGGVYKERFENVSNGNEKSNEGVDCCQEGWFFVWMFIGSGVWDVVRGDVDDFVGYSDDLMIVGGNDDGDI